MATTVDDRTELRSYCTVGFSVNGEINTEDQKMWETEQTLEETHVETGRAWTKSSLRQ